MSPCDMKSLILQAVLNWRPTKEVRFSGPEYVTQFVVMGELTLQLRVTEKQQTAVVKYVQIIE